jgi:uncharacterized OB-fold protein
MVPLVQCRNCRNPAFPPAFTCRRCGHTEFEETEVSGTGTVYTHTTIRVAPAAYRDQAPYIIGIIELGDNLRVTARIEAEDGEKPEIGDPVSFARVDENGYWFRPAS